LVKPRLSDDHVSFSGDHPAHPQSWDRGGRFLRSYRSSVAVKRESLPVAKS
jgi:hypothetical protein